MDVDDLVLKPPRDVWRKNLHEPREDQKIDFVFFEQLQQSFLRPGALVPGDHVKRQLVLFCERFEVGPITDDQHRFGAFQLSLPNCAHDALDAVRFTRHQNGHALTSRWVGEPHPDVHLEEFSELAKSLLNRRCIQLILLPRGLQRHAELTARDLFFKRFDIGLLFEQEIRDAGNDSGFVAADDSDRGKLLHGGQ